jgi:predicted nuclease of predicted toxin-antitoxin system
MHFLFDENMPIQLARGVQLLDKENELGKPPVTIVDHICDHIKKGSPDTDVVRLAKKLGAVVVSQDDDYKTIQATHQLVKKLKIGYVLFKSPKKLGSTYDEIVQAFIGAWPALKEKLRDEKPPFMFTIHPNGKVSKDEKFRR